MRIATWNVNHRVGTTRFRPEAADAIAAIEADVVVVTEYYPKLSSQDDAFREQLTAAGWPFIVASDSKQVVANRILIASRTSLEPMNLSPPGFDEQFPSNILAVTVPAAGLRVIGMRVPAYRERRLVDAAWAWLESALGRLHDAPTVVLGDLNVSLGTAALGGREHFRRILAAGWSRAAPASGFTYYGPNERRSEIDHILVNGWCDWNRAEYATRAGQWCLAGAPDAISDHAALAATVSARRVPAPSHPPPA